MINLRGESNIIDVVAKPPEIYEGRKTCVILINFPPIATSYYCLYITIIYIIVILAN